MIEQPTEIASVLCPQCRALLPVSMDHCSECGYSTRSGGASHDTRFIDRPWVLVVLFLHVGLLGIPVYWATRYSWQTRLAMVFGSILYTVVAVAGIVWGCLQVWKFIQVLAS